MQLENFAIKVTVFFAFKKVAIKIAKERRKKPISRKDKDLRRAGGYNLP